MNTEVKQRIADILEHIVAHLRIAQGLEPRVALQMSREEALRLLKRPAFLYDLLVSVMGDDLEARTQIKANAMWLMEFAIVTHYEKYEQDERTPDDEPVFILPAHYNDAADTVREWANRAAAVGVDAKKIDDALRRANDMDDWMAKKVAREIK